MNILVLCTGNSARSILLESILNRDPRIDAYSAGSKPAGKVHPGALKLLSDKGFKTAELRSKSWDEFGGADAPVMDAVITVCGNAANETCPMWPGAPVRAHWGVDDPAAAAEQDWDTAFATAYDILNARAEMFLRLPFQQFTTHDLEEHLQRIGQI